MTQLTSLNTCVLDNGYILGVPKKTIHCLISRNVKSIKAISLE